MKKIFVVITAYNEKESIGTVLDKLKKAKYKNIIVVNDGSTDKTEEIAKQRGVVVLTHIINRNQGASLVTGNTYALQNGADIIVHFDADDQMEVSDIPAMINPILSGGTDMTIGSRFLTAKSNMPLSKIIILWFGSLHLILP